MADKPSAEEKIAEGPGTEAVEKKPAEAKESAAATKAAPAAKAKASAPSDVSSSNEPKTVADEERERLSFHNWLKGLVWSTPSWLVSMVFHAVLLLILAFMTIEPPKKVTQQLVVTPEEATELEDLEIEDIPLEEMNLDTEAMVVDAVAPQVDAAPTIDESMAAQAVELSEFGLEHAPKNDLATTVGAYSGSALDGRGNKDALVARYGGTSASEKAVALALKWLAEHQMPDGGWSFAHHLSPRCHGQCANPGELVKARIAATSLALLPFLGAGQTHKTGKYKATVNRGLYFLVGKMKVSPKGGDMTEEGGSMYAHGLATITLCEAYAMTHDKGLYQPAQQAVNFICYAQDPVGGGWRYQPRQKGDTSVVGWQLMSLKSAHMAYLTVPPVVVKKAYAFLDSVQANSGSHYGYTDPGQGQATTAIGLLCRMYLGWKHDNPALERGAQWLSNQGPSKGNMYYNYYATQVMRHYEGDMWTKWNDKMRDQLVDSQSTEGHTEGSWYFGGGDHGAEKGGRIYCTALAAMTLEVYYRHMPIYGAQSTEEEFAE